MSKKSLKKISYAVVIPSNRTFEQILPLLSSLSKQTLPPDQIVVVWDHAATKSEFDVFCISVTITFAMIEWIRVDIVHPRTDKNFVIGKGASYVRNSWRRKVKTSSMVFVDDDNICPEDRAENLFGFITHQNHPEHTIVAPIQYDGQTTQVRYALAPSFSFVYCRPRRKGNYYLRHPERYHPLMLASSNCLAWPTALFAQYPFPEDIPFVYEDLVMMAKMYRGGVQILVDSRATITHNHHHKNKLSELYGDTPQRAYWKAKHRIILVHTLGTWWQKIIFYLTGFRGQIGWLVFHMIYHAPMSQWWKLFSALGKWTRDGIQYVINEKKKDLKSNE